MKPWILVAALLTVPATGDIPARLQHLAQAIPAPNKLVKLSDLGINIVLPMAKDTDTDAPYRYVPPTDLDNRSTDDPPYAGQFPDMHLNLPLEVQPGPVNNLFMSDQPEEIQDDREREDHTTGATGLYSMAEVAGQAPLRVLMDQTNGTSRPLRLWLVWVPEQDGTVMVRSRGVSIQYDSVLAGAQAFEQAIETPVAPREAATADTSLPLESCRLAPGQTAVVQETFTSTTPGHVFSIVTEVNDAAPTAESIAARPVLHSIRWGEEAQRLTHFIDPQVEPHRYDRILQAFQHARGRFHFPDRMATACYDVDSWQDSAWPVQIYSLFESIPGADGTMEGATTNNRGRYGAQVEFKLTLEHLPPGCTQGALLVLNPGGIWGGRHIVSDGHNISVDSLFLSNRGPGLLRTDEAATLWRGPVADGMTLTLSTEPMANTSVALWYAFVPLPPGPTGERGGHGVTSQPPPTEANFSPQEDAWVNRRR